MGLETWRVAFLTFFGGHNCVHLKNRFELAGGDRKGGDTRDKVNNGKMD